MVSFRTFPQPLLLFPWTHTVLKRCRCKRLQNLWHESDRSQIYIRNKILPYPSKVAYHVLPTRGGLDAERIQSAALCKSTVVDICPGPLPTASYSEPSLTPLAYVVPTAVSPHTERPAPLYQRTSKSIPPLILYASFTIPHITPYAAHGQLTSRLFLTSTTNGTI